MGREGATPHPVIVVSRDPLVVLAVKAAPGGRVHLLQHEASPAGIRWPANGPYSVVLDIGPHQRRAAYEAVRRHHPERLILILGPDEPSELPPDPASMAIKRPFRSTELLDLLTAPPAEPEPAQSAGVVRERPPPAPAQARPTVQVPTWSQARVIATSQPASNGGRPAGTTVRAPLAPASARRSLGRRILAAVLVPSIVGLLAFVVWFLGGVLEAARDLGASSHALRAKLAQVDAALADGDVAAASAAVDKARADLGTTLAAANRRPVRMAAHVPVLSASIVDLQHLVNAAAYVTLGADRAVGVYAKLGMDRPTLLRDDRVDLSVLAQTRIETDALLADVTSARAELKKVRGGLLEPGVDRARAEGLAQLEAVEGRIRPIISFLNLMPNLLGLDRDRTYLVVLTNLAESRPSGGIPEAVVRLRMSDGLVKLQGRPAGIVENLQGTRVSWRALPEDPWRPGMNFTEFADANSSPHFPTSGEELLRAYEAMAGGPADGVVSVDPLALRGFLGVTGGLTVPGYGRLTSDNVATLIMRDAYRRWPDRNVRWRHNQALLEALLQELFDGRQFLTKAKALGSEGRERHLQVHMRDRQLRQATAAARLDGALAPAAHDYLAAYTRNEDDIRLDFGQQRSIQQRVGLLGDGSANVTRTMVISYPAGPRARPGSPGDGASAAGGTSTVAVYLPPAATELRVRVNDRPVRATQAREAGRPFVRVSVTVRPGASVVVETSYRLASAAVRTAGGLRYELATDPQPMVQPARLTLEVAVPEGMTARPGQDWSILGRTATRTVPLSAPSTSQLELEHE
jgi:hypothetical protein